MPMLTRVSCVLPREVLTLRFLDPAFQDLQEAVEAALGEEAMAKAPEAEEKLCSTQTLVQALKLIWGSFSGTQADYVHGTKGP